MKQLSRKILDENIEKIANYDLDNHNLFGSSYLVFQNDEIILKKHYGYTDIDASEIVNDGTIYRLASMTKPITAVAVLILVQRGLLSLDDPVSKFLPEFDDIHIITMDGKDLGKPKTKVNIMHCLTHTSGFGSEKSIDLTDDDMKNMANTIRVFSDAGLDFEPFENSVYSAVGAFDVLGTIIEKVTGWDYARFLKKEIFEPCNMKDTTFAPTDEQQKRIISMHNKKNEKNEIGKTYPGCVFERFPNEHKLAGAGLVSTLDDYSNFAKMLLQKGEFDGKRIISEETFEKLRKSYMPMGAISELEGWGLGVRVILNESYGPLPVGAFGWSGAYGSHFWIDPENEIFGVYMKNSRFDGGAGNASARRFETAVSEALV